MQKVDLVLRNAKYLDADKREFVEGDIAIKDGKIVGINGNFSGKEEKDLTGKYITPGFIDGHIHLESSVISPEDFAKIASIHGTTAVVTDPHEIANVCGIDGIKYKSFFTPGGINYTIFNCHPSAIEFCESRVLLHKQALLVHKTEETAQAIYLIL